MERKTAERWVDALNLLYLARLVTDPERVRIARRLNRRQGTWSTRDREAFVAGYLEASRLPRDETGCHSCGDRVKYGHFDGGAHGLQSLAGAAESAGCDHNVTCPGCGAQVWVGTRRIPKR